MANPRSTRKSFGGNGWCPVVKITGANLRIRKGLLGSWQPLDAKFVELRQGFKVTVSQPLVSARKSGRTR